LRHAELQAAAQSLLSRWFPGSGIPLDGDDSGTCAASSSYGAEEMDTDEIPLVSEMHAASSGTQPESNPNFSPSADLEQIMNDAAIFSRYVSD
jgi:hypothetical protein